MTKLATITFTVELERDLDQGDTLDEDALTDIAMEQLINDLTDSESDLTGFIEDYVTIQISNY